MMKKVSFLLLWILLLGLQAVQAQIQGSSIHVVVVPDHQDWRYEVGETATFKICVTKSNTLLCRWLGDVSECEEAGCHLERWYADAER